jgi:hypothetical protein
VVRLGHSKRELESPARPTFTPPSSCTGRPPQWVCHDGSHSVDDKCPRTAGPGVVHVPFSPLAESGWLGVWACMGLSPCRPYWVFRACCVCVYVCVCALLGNLGHLWARLGHSKRELELLYRTTFAPPSSWDWTTTPMG